MQQQTLLIPEIYFQCQAFAQRDSSELTLTPSTQTSGSKQVS